MPALDRLFLDCSARTLRQHCSRIEDCIGRLTSDQIWLRGSPNANSVGNLVLHLCGNIRQWIGFGAGNLENIRDRDAEFAASDGGSASELATKLLGTVEEAIAILRGVSAARLEQIVTIQSYRVTLLEAVYHAVEHFAQHTGQILFATKQLTGQDLGYYRHLSVRTTTVNPDNSA